MKTSFGQGLRRFLLLPAFIVSGIAVIVSCGGNNLIVDSEREMPEVHLITCEEADCGPNGTCHTESGQAVCQCAPGAARAMPHLCIEQIYEPSYRGVELESEPVGCTAPEHCDGELICERLTGRCVERTDERCAPPLSSALGSQVEGGYCINTDGPHEIDGCADLIEADFCGAGLVCTPTGPFGYSILCGYPGRQAGVCRRSCDLCGPSQCPEGWGCMLVEGAGGVCLPLGYTENDYCGEALCQPGEACMLGGMLHGPASGRCAVPCSEDNRACPEDLTCTAVREGRLPGLFFCIEEGERGP